MRIYNIRRGAKAVAILPALLIVVIFAATAHAQSITTVVGSSQADTGPGGQSYLTMTLPNGVATGQLLLAVVVSQQPAGWSPLSLPWAAIYPPAGWTQTALSPRTCGGYPSANLGIAISIGWRIAQEGDTAGKQYWWGFANGPYFTPFPSTGAIVSIANASATAPVQQIVMSCTNDGTGLVAQALNTLQNNTLEILPYTITGDDFISAPSGVSELFQHPIPGVGPNLAIDYMTVPNAQTNTGNLTATASTAGEGFGYQISIAPAAQ